MKQTDIRLVDQRMVHRNIEQGLISSQDYDKYLKSLPDDAKEAVQVSFETLLEEESKLPPLSSLSPLK